LIHRVVLDYTDMFRATIDDEGKTLFIHSFSEKYPGATTVMPVSLRTGEIGKTITALPKDVVACNAKTYWTANMDTWNTYPDISMVQTQFTEYDLAAGKAIRTLPSVAGAYGCIMSRDGRYDITVTAKAMK